MNFISAAVILLAFLALLVQTRDARRITAAEMKSY